MEGNAHYFSNVRLTMPPRRFPLPGPLIADVLVLT